jgi:LPPG:FO 2-phospho-L-lactate transferase
VSAPVVVLAGGTGGAKLARGMQDVVGEDLVVVANTGDDIEIYGAHVSPDPDLVTFWLADRIDERGWGLEGDTFAVMDGLRDLGREVWFNLGDRDLAIGVERAARLAAGERLTDALGALGTAFGLEARVLPMSDDRVRTRVSAHGREWGLQEFLIEGRGAGPVDGVEFEGITSAHPTPEVLQAIAGARAVIIGPSNPVISIGPILALPGLREALVETDAPVVAVSPLVAGEVLKGPTAAFLEWLGRPLSSDGIAAIYAGLLDGLLADSPTDAVATRVGDVLMADAEGRRRVAGAALEFAEALAG